MPSTQYWNHINSAKWKAFANKVRKKRKSCEACGRWGVMNVHHLHYRTFGNEGQEDVMLLCRACHGKIHKALSKYRKRDRVAFQRRWVSRKKALMVAELVAYVSLIAYFAGVPLANAVRFFLL